MKTSKENLHVDTGAKRVKLVSRNVDTMDLFMLPRDVRCRVLSLLLGAVKIERDQHIVSKAINAGNIFFLVTNQSFNIYIYLTYL